MVQLELTLKDLTRTVRLKKSRNILRAAFKNHKEQGFDEAWRDNILAPILDRNGFTMQSIGTVSLALALALAQNRILDCNACLERISQHYKRALGQCHS